MDIVFNLLVAGAFLLYVLVLQRLIRFYAADYSMALAYTLLLLFSGIVQLMFSNSIVTALWGYSYAEVYWASDLARYVLASALVITLILRALAGSSQYRWAGRWLIAGTVLIVLALVALHWDARLTRMMTNVVRNFSFVAMLMNFLLWVLLLKRRTSDRMLLLVTSGLGIQLAGEAIGHSLRLMHSRTELAGNLVLAIAHLCCLWIWFAAFRPKSAGATVAAGR